MYNEFENAIIRGIYISRYVASWTNSGGTFTRVRQKCSLKDWLRTLSIDGEKLTEDEIQRIWNYATNGKMELEHSAKDFLSNK